MQLAVEIEDQQSWPPGFMDEVVNNRPLLLDYHLERARIDKLAEDDILVRVKPPQNEHKRKYKALVERLEHLLRPHRLVAYHCTRLTPGEVSSIRTNGLRLLTPRLTTEKIAQCHADGHLDNDAYEYLRNSKTIADNVGNVHGNRTDMIWFCPNRSTLQEYLGVYRLFRSWGGEAIYCGHEKDQRIASTLCAIGTPCIVKCAISFKRVDQFYENFSERFTSQFISDEIECPEPSAGFTVKTTQDLSAADIVEIIEFSDPRFTALTGCSKWPEHFRISGAAAQHRLA
jgi:hypothetical protein